MSRAIVLLSAGLDSSYNLFRSHRNGGVALALTFDYGQRAAPAEKRQAALLCKRLGIPHKILDLTWFHDFTSTALLGKTDLPLAGQVSIDDMVISTETKKAVWVPNRNGIFLNIAAGFAEGLKASFVVPGFNLEEASTFPDNSRAYAESLDYSFAFSTETNVKVKCYSMSMTKTEIATDAVKIGVPLKDLWPCYQNEPEWCGECESCQRFKRATKGLL